MLAIHATGRKSRIRPRFVHRSLEPARVTTSRSNFIAGVSAAATAVAVEGKPAFAAQTLASAATRNHRFFGSAVRVDQLDNEPDLRGVAVRECTYVVPEVEMNWNAIEPFYGQLAFEKVDALVDFAGSNHKLLRGHTLLWHLGTPGWAFEMLRERRDWALIERHFGSLIGRYGSVIEQWEVVNEPIDVGYRLDGLRETIFLEAFGPDYIARALTQARALAPRAQLLINEYGLEYDVAEERERRYLLLKLLERLRRANVPLDALGVQGHLDLRKGHVSQPAIGRFLEDVAGLGLAIVVTELDVKEADYVATAEQRDRLVADEVRRYLDVVLAHGAVAGVTTWGLSDRHSWLLVMPEDYARFPGAWKDGSGPGLNRGLPFDSSMRPKPMYDAIREAFSAARSRN